MPPQCCLCVPDFMKRFLGLEMPRQREIPPWAQAFANQDIAPWQKELPFPSTNWQDPKKHSTMVQTQSPHKANRQETESSLDISRRSTLPGRRSSAELEPLESLDNTEPNTPSIEWQPPGYFTGEDNPRRKGRTPVTLPTRIPEPAEITAEKKKTAQPKLPKEVSRSWPEQRKKNERRIVASNYAAVEIHGFFGLIDDGSVGEGRMLIVHVPKWIRGYFLDIKQGDNLHVYHSKGMKIGAALTVLSTGRHKYYAPGRRVMTCTVCVSEEQWAPFT